jgi:hypothetical protein
MRQCAALGFDVPDPIHEPSPTLDRLEGFFGREADWVYFGGHFNESALYNDKATMGIKGAVVITFARDHIDLQAGSATRTIAGCGKLRSARLICWAGCSTLANPEVVRDLAALFDAPVMIGFRRRTGPKMCDAMFSGGRPKQFIHKPFFARIAGALDDPIAWRKAWLQAALEGHAGTENEDRFAAIDSDGTEWLLRNKAIVRGRKLF